MAVKADESTLPKATTVRPDQVHSVKDVASTAPAGPDQSAEDIAWWNLKQNQNYMPGGGPHTGITEVEGHAQSASSVDPEVRAKTLAESKEKAASAEADKAVDQTTEAALADAKAKEGK